MKPCIRWMLRRDMPEILEIERLGFADPWTEQDYVGHLRCRDKIGMVAELDDMVVGAMLYQLARQHIALIRLAVHPDHIGRGIGRLMIDKLVGKLSSDRRATLTAEVCETNLGGQLFLRACGMKAVQVIRGGHGDLYVFERGVAEGAARKADWQ